MALPFIKFYGTAWRADAGLRLCSEATRGVWIDCLTLMMEADPYGHLVIEGNAAQPDDIAKLTSSKPQTVARALAELKRRGVCGVTVDGVIYSRRMVRDRQKLEEAKDNGRRGGNPALKDKPPDGPSDNGGVNPSVIVPNKPTETEALATPENQPEKQPHKVTRENQKLETRSEKTDSTAQPDVTGAARDPAVQPWVALIQAFDQAIQAVEPSLARPWPNGLDGTVARRMLERGVSPTIVREITEARLRQHLGQGKPGLLKALSYVEAACYEALAGRAPPGALAKGPPAGLTAAEDERLAHLMAFLKLGGSRWPGGGPPPASIEAASAEVGTLEAKLQAADPLYIPRVLRRASGGED